MSRLLKVVVAGMDPQGDSDWFFVKVEVPDDFDLADEEEIRHRVAAMRYARSEGWEPVLTYVELDLPFPALNEHAIWESVSTIPLEDTDDDDLCATLGFAALAAMDLLVGFDDADRHDQLVSKSVRWLAEDQTEGDNS